ncbi:MAG: hypothetical protein VW378_01635 [bacterium]
MASLAASGVGTCTAFLASVAVAGIGPFTGFAYVAGTGAGPFTVFMPYVTGTNSCFGAFGSKAAAALSVVFLLDFCIKL